MDLTGEPVLKEAMGLSLNILQNNTNLGSYVIRHTCLSKQQMFPLYMTRCFP